MARKIAVSLPDGRQVQATEIEVETANERWSEYRLQDGTVFRAKINLLTVVRVDGEYDPQGMPIYQINAAPAIAVMEVPEALKRKPQ